MLCLLPKDRRLKRKMTAETDFENRNASYQEIVSSVEGQTFHFMTGQIRLLMKDVIRCAYQTFRLPGDAAASTSRFSFAGKSIPRHPRDPIEMFRCMTAPVCKPLQNLVCRPGLALAGGKGCVDYKTYDLADCCGVEQAGAP